MVDNNLIVIPGTGRFKKGLAPRKKTETLMPVIYMAGVSPTARLKL
jgi:hypothetical protein